LRKSKGRPPSVAELVTKAEIKRVTRASSVVPRRMRVAPVRRSSVQKIEPRKAMKPRAMQRPALRPSREIVVED